MPCRYQPGKWVMGALARQVWSFAGDGDRQDVSQFLIQPFLNHNFDAAGTPCRRRS